jgi:MFS family permease
VSHTFDKRILIVAGALLVQSVTIGCMFAYGVFFKVLEDDMGWSRTLLSASSSVAFLAMGLLAVLAGRLNDRYGPRWVLTFSGLCTGIGYAGMYFLTAPWQMFVLFGVFVGIGMSTHDVVTLSTIARWYEKRRGAMTGLVKVGTACGQMAVPLFATALIAAYDWRLAFMILGVLAAVLLVIAAQLVGVNPQRSAASPRDLGEGMRYADARRTRQFWTLCAIQFSFFPSLMSIPVHITVHATDLGFELGRAALVMSAIAGCSILGRLTVGGLIDRIGGRRALLICFVPLLGSLVFLRLVDLPLMLFVFALFYGFAHGGLFTVVSPTIAEFFGMQSHGEIFGSVLFFGTLGGAAGPLLCGRIYDVTGSYDLAFTVLAILAFIGLLLVLSLKPLPPMDAPVPDAAS